MKTKCKKLMLLIAIILLTIPSIAQLRGEFYTARDGHIYFQAINTLGYNFNVFVIPFLSGALVTFYVSNSIKNRNFKINKSNIKIYLSFSSIFVGSFLLEYLSAAIVHSVNNL